MTQSLEIKDSESAIIILFHIKIKTLEMNGKIVLHREIERKKEKRERGKEGGRKNKGNRNFFNI